MHTLFTVPAAKPAPEPAIAPLPLICEGWEGPCTNPGTRQRQNTAYADDARNFRVLCDECQAMATAYWNEMWSDYWAGRFA